MSSGKKRPTLRDVAQVAGVSYQSVSRVINDQPGVSDRLRAKIKRIMRDMHYQPNRAAQMLSSQRSKLIEVITTSVFFEAPLAAIMNAVKAHGYHVTFNPVGPDPAQFKAAIRGAEARMVGGMLLLPIDVHFDDETELFELCGAVPFVQLIAMPGSKVPSVVVDQVAGAQMAVQHLIDLGHTQIAHVCGPATHVDAITRAEGWQDTLVANGLTPGPMVMGDFRAASGRDAVHELLDTGETFTAVFAGNDDMAFGVLDGLRARGLRVPDDVSVVGFDNIELSEAANPRLTTVDQDFRELGALAVGYLLEFINNPQMSVHQRVIQPELIIRDSTCPPKT